MAERGGTTIYQFNVAAYAEIITAILDLLGIGTARHRVHHSVVAQPGDEVVTCDMPSCQVRAS